MSDYEKIPLRERISHAWNVFKNKDPSYNYWDMGQGYAGSRAPNRPRLSIGAEKSIVTAVYNRIAVDTASLVYKHVQLDEEGRYVSTENSYLNKCLTRRANLDQTGRAFIEDLVLRMLDNGVAIIAPTETTEKPDDTESFDIKEMRVADLKEWFPDRVRFEIYNPITGEKEEYVRPKRTVGIVENPYYSVMNEPNSTAQRLMHKLSLLDAIDDRNGADRLDLIIQVPYTIKTNLQRRLANRRIEDLTQQMRSSNLGIGFIDGSEKVVQLNRAVENQLREQITDLTSTLLSQLGMTMEILNGTAKPEELNNYFNRTIEPIAAAITDEMTTKFLSENALTRGKAVMFFRDPFKLLSPTDFAEIADKLTRNEIATSNEIRQKIGMMPSKDPKADELRNSNISESKDQQDFNVYGDRVNNTGGFNQNGR